MRKNSSAFCVRGRRDRRQWRKAGVGAGAGHMTHEYVFARGRERDRRGGVRLLDGFVQRELVARLCLIVREEGGYMGVGGMGCVFHVADD
jgi:hypothetical protein